MAFVKMISADDRSLQLVPDDRRFAKFFDIDSCHLILGKNGSGKTELLMRVATIVAQQRGDVDIFVEGEDGGARLMTTADRRKLGVLFYTGLPYRRKLPSSSRVVDASLNGRDGSLMQNLQAFKSVSEKLGVKTDLRGSVGFTSSVFSNIILPSLQMVRDRYELDPEIRAILDVWPTGVFSEKLGDESLLERGYRMQSIRGEYSEKIRRAFQKLRPESSLLIELAVLEQMAMNSRGKADLGHDYLVYCGLLKNQGRFISKSFDKEFEKKVQITEGHLQRQKNVTRKNSEISFRIHTQAAMDELTRLDTAIRVEWSHLSSGMRAMIDQFSRISSGIERLSDRGIKKILVLIDEGDAFLHLEWQRRYVDLLNKTLSKLKQEAKITSLQVILTTHSPVIATDFPSSFVTNLDKAVHPEKTFAAPLDDVTLGSFGSSSIGTFAAHKINDLHQRILDGEVHEDDAELLEEIGDIVIRNALRRVKSNRYDH